MTRFHLVCRHLLVLLAALGVMFTGSSPVAAAQPAPATRALVVTAAPGDGAGGTIIVNGRGFTPGGDVYIALYDQWGSRQHETRWVQTSASIYGPNGSADPAAGYVAGGRFSEVFAGLCGATPMARAYDVRAAAWSAWLDIDTSAIACDGTPVRLDRPNDLF